jgi:diguanylate cyclase (GGDEF)-like protein
MVVDREAEALVLDAHVGVSPPLGTAGAELGAGIGGAVVETGQPIVVPSGASDDPRLSPMERALAQDTLLAAPLPDTTGVMGVVFASRNGGRSEFTDVDMTLLTMLGRSVGSTLQTSGLIRNLRQTATTDSLTGLYNHGAFLEQLAEHARRAQAAEDELSLIILDIDRFKRVNDLAGHWQGDRVLKALANALRQQCRTTDVIGRCGGDEFAVLLPRTGPDEAGMIVERAVTALRQVGEEMRLPVPVSASWGVACFPWDASDDEALFRKADARLYEAKQLRGERLAFENIVA